jgi:hypothetical protein
MAKSAAALQRALESKPQAAAPAAVEAKPKGTSEQPGRVGKVQIAAYLSQDYKRNLRLIQVNEDRSIQSLMAEALNLLFQKHNAPTIEGE